MDKYQIKYDLDGVLRDLIGYFCNYFKIPPATNWNIKYNNKSIFQLIEENKYNILVDSPVTKYFKTIKNNTKNIEIWTHQLNNWIPYTEIWIKKYIGECKIRYLETSEKEDRLYSLKDTYLVEDCPNFTNYEKILLIDMPYNQHIKVPNRIRTPLELEVWLKGSK